METAKNARTNFENLDVYKLSEKLAAEIWRAVGSWDRFARETVGRQVVRAADSIGANIAEGAGRGSFQDNRRFVRTARGSLNETKHWLRRAHTRQLLTPVAVKRIKPLVDQLSPRLNAYLHSIGNRPEAAPTPHVSPRMTGNGQRTTDNALRTTDNGQTTTDN